MRLRRFLSAILVGSAITLTTAMVWRDPSLLSKVGASEDSEAGFSGQSNESTLGMQDEQQSDDASAQAALEDSVAAAYVKQLLPSFEAEVEANSKKRVADAVVTRGSSLSMALRSFGLDAVTIDAISTSLAPHRHPARIPAGTQLEAQWSSWPERAPQRLSVRLDTTRNLIAEASTHGWQAHIEEKPITSSLAAYAGVVTSSLWSSAASAGMDPQLISKLAEVFAWQVDFNREVRINDRWRLTVERRFVDGQAIGFGDIIAAEYENGGTVLTAVRHLDNDSNASYYAPDGSSLRRMFRRSPLEYARITSAFAARRFHPILKINRPHLGVDYGAATGTPIMSVGDGVITFAARNGGSGNMVHIRHNAVYQTNYKHLSAFAQGIRPGTRVRMGQVIGYVGATGLATGPHLHFEFSEHGRVVDPLGLRFPVADPIPAQERSRFVRIAEHQVNELPPWSRALLSEQQGSKPTAGE